ncbi:hypothetical protein FRC10_004843 [Ceratobasidium sp. 414]|nr:hypothetical protein FRC10_004843 [Ceratobasidium sp. 414]
MSFTHHEIAGEKDTQGIQEKHDEFHTIESARSTNEPNPKQVQQLLRKLDRHILPWMAGLFLLSYLDRSNIGNARLDNLEKDLGMHGLQFNNALAIFYPFYVIAEVPSNMMLKRTRASLMVSWGTIMTLMGLVKSYTGLMIARVFLGIAEGGLFPGIAFYITLWYRRSETGTRMAIYYAAAAAAYFFIPDDPSSATFLTPEERAEVIRRLEDDNNGLAQEYGMIYFWQAVKDWKTYAYSTSPRDFRTNTRGSDDV